MCNPLLLWKQRICLTNLIKGKKTIKESSWENQPRNSFLIQIIPMLFVLSFYWCLSQKLDEWTTIQWFQWSMTIILFKENCVTQLAGWTTGLGNTIAMNCFWWYYEIRFFKLGCQKRLGLVLQSISLNLEMSKKNWRIYLQDFRNLTAGILLGLYLVLFYTCWNCL